MDAEMEKDNEILKKLAYEGTLEWLEEREQGND